MLDAQARSPPMKSLECCGYCCCTFSLLLQSLQPCSKFAVVSVSLILLVMCSTVKIIIIKTSDDKTQLQDFGC